MKQKRKDPRRSGQNSTRPSPKGQGNTRRAYDWTKDQRASGSPGSNRRVRPQGYQEQMMDFTDGGVTFENGKRRSNTRQGRPDNSIQFPQQAARRPNGQNRQTNPNHRPASQNSRPAGQRPRPNNTTVYPGNQRPRKGPQNRPQNNSGRYRPTQDNLRSPSRRENRKKRRLTRAALRRRRAIRRLTALALLLCVIAIGVYLTVTMLFKINTLKVVADGAVVDQVGGYSSAEILETLGVHAEENIFSFDPAEKAKLLEKQYPMLEHIRVERDYPNTVVVKVEAAEPAYAMQTAGGWLSLSADLKILNKDSAQPDLPVLYGGAPVSTTPGAQLEFELPEQPAESDSDSAASSEAALPEDKRLESLNTLLTALDSMELSADVTRVEFEDTEEMAFLYQGRISVLLGTLNELDYKLKLAKYVLLNEDGKGCSATDTGMLDLSHLSASTTRKFRFAQGQPTLPSGYIAPEVTNAPVDEKAGSSEEKADSEAETSEAETEEQTDEEDTEETPTDDTTATEAEQQ